MRLLGWRTLFAAGKSIRATRWRTAIAAANTRCDNGVIHPLLAVIRGDRAFVVGQLDGTGSTKVRHAPPRNGAIELSALEEPDAIPAAAVSVNPEPAWNPSSIRGGRTLVGNRSCSLLLDFGRGRALHSSACQRTRLDTDCKIGNRLAAVKVWVDTGMKKVIIRPERTCRYTGHALLAIRGDGILRGQPPDFRQLAPGSGSAGRRCRDC